MGLLFCTHSLPTRSLLSNVIHFDGTRVNVILFTPIRNVQSSLRRFYETHNAEPHNVQITCNEFHGNGMINVELHREIYLCPSDK
jgi:hypothetical protein